MKIDPNIRDQFAPEVYKKACKLYLATNASIISELKTTCFTERARLLHKLKGGAEMLGFIEMGELLSKAELNIKTDFSKDIEYLFNKIKREL